MLLEQNARTKW